MEHELELIIARLEILEIEVCSISYKPRDIGNLSFSTSSYPGNIGNLSFSTSSYPGNIGSYDPYVNPIVAHSESHQAMSLLIETFTFSAYLCLHFA